MTPSFTSQPMSLDTAAVGVAAALELRDTLRGKRAGVIPSGGNLDTAILWRIVNSQL
jgi:threonine dehydratase